MKIIRLLLAITRGFLFRDTRTRAWNILRCWWGEKTHQEEGELTDDPSPHQWEIVIKDGVKQFSPRVSRTSQRLLDEMGLGYTSRSYQILQRRRAEQLAYEFEKWKLACQSPN